MVHQNSRTAPRKECVHGTGRFKVRRIYPDLASWSPVDAVLDLTPRRRKELEHWLRVYRASQESRTTLDENNASASHAIQRLVVFARGHRG